MSPPNQVLGHDNSRDRLPSSKASKFATASWSAVAEMQGHLASATPPSRAGGATSAKPRPELRESAITIPALLLKLDGPKATATLTETQDANPQVIEATLEGSAIGPVGIADFGTPVTFANFFVRE